MYSHCISSKTVICYQRSLFVAVGYHISWCTQKVRRFSRLVFFHKSETACVETPVHVSTPLFMRTRLHLLPGYTTHLHHPHSPARTHSQSHTYTYKETLFEKPWNIQTQSHIKSKLPACSVDNWYSYHSPHPDVEVVFKQDNRDGSLFGYQKECVCVCVRIYHSTQRPRPDNLWQAGFTGVSGLFIIL